MYTIHDTIQRGSQYFAGEPAVEAATFEWQGGVGAARRLDSGDVEFVFADRDGLVIHEEIVQV